METPGGAARIIWLVLKKILSLALTIFIIASVIFWMFCLASGDPARLFVPRGASPEVIQQLTEEFHLDEPLLVQYFHYIVDAFTFDLRMSWNVYGHDINDYIWRHVVFTVMLFIPVFLISMLVGWTVEKYVYSKKRRRVAFGIHGLSLFLASVHMVGIYFLVLYLVIRYTRIRRFWGNGTESQELSLGLLPDILMHLVLPVLVGTLSAAGFLILLRRAGRMEVGHDRLWGIQRSGRWKPGLAMLEYLCVLRPYLRFYVAWTMACVLAVDLLFSYRGLGYAVWHGVVSSDYPFMMAGLYTISLLTLAAIVSTTIAVNLLRRRPISELFADWVSHDRDSTSAVPISGTVGHEMSVKNLLVGLLRGLSASKIGFAAVAVLVVFALLAAFAPWLAIVDDPMAGGNREPNVIEGDQLYLNPLPPSLERSPYTGLLHPLGTDHMGRDVFSLWLYSARSHVAVVVMGTVLTVVVSLFVGGIAVRTIGVSGDDAARIIDFVLTAAARAAIVIPLTVFGGCLTVLMGLGEGLLPIYISLAMLAWAQVFVIRRVRARVRVIAENTGKMRPSVKALMPCILNTSLCSGKLALLIITATMTSIWLIRLGGTTWVGMLATAYYSDSLLRGDWHLLIPPNVGLVLLTASVFLVLDRLEVVAKRLDTPESIKRNPIDGRLTQNPSEALIGHSKTG